MEFSLASATRITQDPELPLNKTNHHLMDRSTVKLRYLAQEVNTTPVTQDSYYLMLR